MRTVTLNMIDRSRYDENEGGQPIEETVPCDIAVDEIRCYYPRKAGRVGTRLTFKDRGGFAVKDSFDEVRAAVNAARGAAATSATAH